ncbi:MAG: hypothetical protein AB7S38_36170 [Vulcanimicrobiota bacterium]
MSEISDLQSYLATLGRDGRRDSQGRFSLSTEKALAKLAEFQLLDPSLYAVHLVAAAVTAQAQRVEISHATDRIEFEFDRPICQADELENLYSAVSISHDQTWLRHLAIGVHVSGAYRPQRVSVESFAHGQGSRLVMEAGHHHTEPLSGPWRENIEGTRVVLEFGRSLARTASFGLLGVEPPELSTLLRLCRYAPLTLTLNGKRLTQAVTLGAAANLLSCLHLDCPTQPLMVRMLTGADCLVEQRPSPGGFSAVLGLGRESLAQFVGLTFICEGVAFRANRALLGFPLAMGVVSAPGLRPDLSHGNIVRDAAYERLVEGLGEQVEEMVLARCRAGLPGSQLLVQEFRKALLGRFESDHPEPVASWLESARGLELAGDEAAFRLSLERARTGVVGWPQLWQEQSPLLSQAFRNFDLKEMEYFLKRLDEVGEFPENLALEEVELVHLARLLARGVEPPESVSSLEPFCWHRRALAYRLRHDYSRAEACHRLDRPGSLTALLLGSLRLAQGDSSGALALYQQACDPPWGPLCLDEMAGLCELLDDRRAAHHYRMQALMARPLEERAYWYDWVYSQSAGVCSFAQRIGLGARASLARLFLAEQPTLDEAEVVMALGELEPDIEAPTRLAFHRGLLRLRQSGLWERADEHFCRRLLRLSIVLPQRGWRLRMPPATLV